MKNIHILSLLMALSFATGMFSMDKTGQAESANNRPIFKVYTLEARKEADYCCEDRESLSVLYGQYLATQNPERQAMVGKWKRENRHICCGRSTQETSHAIGIEKIPNNGKASKTLITPLNLNGVSKADRQLWYKDQVLDNGASFVQNPVTDPDIKFLGGSFDKQGLFMQLAMNAECRAKRIKDRALSQDARDTTAYVTCPNGSYYLRYLAKKSVDELVRKEEK